MHLIHVYEVMYLISGMSTKRLYKRKVIIYMRLVGFVRLITREIDRCAGAVSNEEIEMTIACEATRITAERKIKPVS